MQRACSINLLCMVAKVARLCLAMLSILWQYPLQLHCARLSLWFLVLDFVRFVCELWYFKRALHTHTNTLCVHIIRCFDDKSYIVSFYLRYTLPHIHICIFRMVFLHGRKFIKIIILLGTFYRRKLNERTTNERARFASIYSIWPAFVHSCASKSHIK